jgi:superfamily II DNA helicase RecQ
MPQDVGNGDYSLIYMSPEMFASPAFSDAFKANKFFRRLKRVVIDEVHSVISWDTPFRPGYTMLEHLQSRSPNLSLLFTSATLTPMDIAKVIENFRLPLDSLTVFRRSNERPLMNYIVREVEYPTNTYKDLAFLLGSDRTYATPPPPFRIFTNSQVEAMKTIEALRNMLPEEHRSKLRWVSAATSEPYREWLVKAVVDGLVWGFASTDMVTMVRLIFTSLFYCFCDVESPDLVSLRA